MIDVEEEYQETT